MSAQRHPARHDRDSIADAALRLLDEVGLPDLSMRRLANELDVQPSALYWHFTSKQELLAAVADRILARIGIDSHATDPGSVVGLARSIRDALLAYRDGAEVVMSTYALGLGAGRAHEALAEALSTAAPRDFDARASALLQFILGHALVVQQRLHAESHGAAATSSGQDPSARIETTFDLGVRAFIAELRIATEDHSPV